MIIYMIELAEVHCIRTDLLMYFQDKQRYSGGCDVPGCIHIRVLCLNKYYIFYHNMYKFVLSRYCSVLKGTRQQDCFPPEPFTQYLECF
jgi:hypothetical protein